MLLQGRSFLPDPFPFPLPGPSHEEYAAPGGKIGKEKGDRLVLRERCPGDDVLEPADGDLRSRYSEAATNHAGGFRLTSMIEKTHSLYCRVAQPIQEPF